MVEPQGKFVLAKPSNGFVIEIRWELLSQAKQDFIQWSFSVTHFTIVLVVMQSCTVHLRSARISVVSMQNAFSKTKDLNLMYQQLNASKSTNFLKFSSN